jgi:hypothetical protein
LVSLLAPTYNVARGEFVIKETKREIRPTRKLSGFFVFWGQKKLTVDSLKLKVRRKKKKREKALTQRALRSEHRGHEDAVLGLNPGKGGWGDDYFNEVACYSGGD